jgi:hypothetical protein
MHTCMHAYVHAYVHAYMHTCIHACVHSCIRACLYSYVHACTHVINFIDSHMHTCLQSHLSADSLTHVVCADVPGHGLMEVVVPQGAVPGQTLDIRTQTKPVAPAVVPVAAPSMAASTTAPMAVAPLAPPSPMAAAPVVPLTPTAQMSAAPVVPLMPTSTMAATAPSMGVATAPAMVMQPQVQQVVAATTQAPVAKNLMQTSGSQMLAEAGAFSGVAGATNSRPSSGGLLKTVGELKQIAKILEVKMKEDSWRPGHPQGERSMAVHTPKVQRQRQSIGGAIKGALDAERKAALIVDGLRKGRTA